MSTLGSDCNPGHFEIESKPIFENFQPYINIYLIRDSLVFATLRYVTTCQWESLDSFIRCRSRLDKDMIKSVTPEQIKSWNSKHLQTLFLAKTFLTSCLKDGYVKFSRQIHPNEYPAANISPSVKFMQPYDNNRHVNTFEKWRQKNRFSQRDSNSEWKIEKKVYLMFGKLVYQI